jgi:hypothetical protein
MQPPCPDSTASGALGTVASRGRPQWERAADAEPTEPRDSELREFEPLGEAAAAAVVAR